MRADCTVSYGSASGLLFLSPDAKPRPKRCCGLGLPGITETLNMRDEGEIFGFLLKKYKTFSLVARALKQQVTSTRYVLNCFLSLSHARGGLAEQF